MTHEFRSSDKRVTFEALLFFTRALAALMFVLSFSGPVTGQEVETDEDDPIQCGPVHCFVSIFDLPHQDDVPFAFRNHIMDEHHPQWDRYRGPIQRFPNAQGCLLEEAVQGDIVDLLAVDWGQFDGSDGDVCFFRIFSTLSDGSVILQWLVAAGFANRGIVEQDFSYFSGSDLLDPDYEIYAQWSREQYYENRPTLLNTLFDWGALTSWGPHIYLFEDQVFHSVITSGRSTWN